MGQYQLCWNRRSDGFNATQGPGFGSIIKDTARMTQNTPWKQSEKFFQMHSSIGTWANIPWERP